MPFSQFRHHLSMKLNFLYATCAILALNSCQTFQKLHQPLTGGYDPLHSAGYKNDSSNNSTDESQNSANPEFYDMDTASKSKVQQLSKGEFATANMDQTPFFLKKTDGTSKADKLLANSTSVKIIDSESSFTKVELNSGEIGYVPTLMLNSSNKTKKTEKSSTPVTPIPTFDANNALPSEPTTPSNGSVALPDPGSFSKLSSNGEFVEALKSKISTPNVNKSSKALALPDPGSVGGSSTLESTPLPNPEDILKGQHR